MKRNSTREFDMFDKVIDLSAPYKELQEKIAQEKITRRKGKTA